MYKTTIQIEKRTQERLKRLGAMGDTYDSLIRRLIEEHERLRGIELCVETQHEIARTGKFVELR